MACDIFTLCVQVMSQCSVFIEIKMPIFDNLKLILIHPGKTAGTMLTTVLTQANGGKLLAPGHHGWAWYKNMYPHEWETYRKVAVVRDPYDRFFSCYWYAKMLKSYWHSPDGSTEWGVHQDYNLLKDASPEQCCRYLLNGHLQHPTWTPQAAYITHGNEYMVDYILRYETLAEDFPLLCQHLGISLSAELPTINKTERPEKDILSAEVKASIDRYYHADLIFCSRS